MATFKLYLFVIVCVGCHVELATVGSPYGANLLGNRVLIFFCSSISVPIIREGLRIGFSFISLKSSIELLCSSLKGVGCTVCWAVLTHMALALIYTARFSGIQITPLSSWNLSTIRKVLRIRFHSTCMFVLLTGVLLPMRWAFCPELH